ncbi:hypothetical protein JOM56_004586 [Amanita muscaria]
MKLEKWGPRVFLSDNFSHSHTQNVLSRRSVKRRRVATNPFVDHEAAVTWSDAEEEGEEGEDLVDGLEENSEDSEGAQDFTSIHNAVGAPVTRLEAAIAPVISRIERGALRQTQNEDPAMPENALGPDPFLDNIIRMPAARDPPMWRVRVHESDQTHALWVIHDRLEKTPHLAISASSSPHNRGWIAIESTSIAAVEKLCQTVSAIPQPPRIEFVSPDERIECLRLGVDERLAKFSKDLVLVHNTASYPLVDLFVIPRLPVRLGPSSKKTRVPRLLLPLLFQQVYQKTYADLYPRNIFWYPDKAGLVLEKQTGGIAQLCGLRVTESFLPPFCVFCDIPIEALNFNIKATYSELQIFSEGFESVSNHSFKMTVSTKEFMQLSWEKHVRAPLEVGHRIRASIQQQQIEAMVVEVSYNHVVVNDNASAVQYTLPSDEAKRIFITGDTVKVYVSPSYHGRQGWVLCVQDEDVTVVDVETKTDVTHFTVKSWQLVPFEFDLTYCSDMIQSSPLPVIREYNHFNGLVNQRVLIVGQNSDKGLRGRIKQHLVGHVVRVELESGSRMVDLHVNSLVATTRSGPRLRDYYDENHRTMVIAQRPSYDNTCWEERRSCLDKDDLELLEENTGASFKHNRLTRLRCGRESESPLPLCPLNTKQSLNHQMKISKMIHCVKPKISITYGMMDYNDTTWMTLLIMMRRMAVLQWMKRHGKKGDEINSRNRSVNGELEGPALTLRALTLSEPDILSEASDQSLFISSAWDEMHGVFGNGLDYSWALDDEEAERMSRNRI